MREKIRIGVVGYGNLGKGVIRAIEKNNDMELKAIFTRREGIIEGTENLPMMHIQKVADFKDEIDVMILCGGSRTDLPEQGPMLCEMFNTIDSFDTHARIPEYFKKMDDVSKKGEKLSIISVGWDPGLFSLNRVLGQAILPNGVDYTFWGKGVSQGHSDAIRRVNGVKNAIQYTVPKEEALDRVRSGENPKLETRDKHKRVCYVVVEDGVDKERIENDIKNMENYFKDYDTFVNFITEEELEREHSKMPHGGFVIRTGSTSDGNKQRIEFSLKLDSNPEFTSSILVAYARANYRLSKEGKKGAITVLDVPFSYLSPKSVEELRRELL
ncbi:diaminopimelate dehydrogenase [Clostridium baratii]|uniref:Meso-diaminopimelate D-dehydrogenase n=1 Tax=Clostridium baratii TaxID=1561 RepID=A0A174V9J1_9CLOT|nr:diaminopimelate dehydrogenase [Clostridium baratii]CUQ31262.1 diaminopimelate dehydrogenase [Clostridium baratii]